MLSRVLSLAIAQGWIDGSRPFKTVINLTQGNCLWLLFTLEGRSHTYLKFSTHIALELEARRCAEASRCYPGLAPQFVGWACQRELQALACRAVDYVGLNRHRMADLAIQRRLFEALLPYFAAQPQSHLPADLATLEGADSLSALRVYFQKHPANAVAQRWLNEPVAMRLGQGPGMPQHGDLVLNNLGLVAGGGLVLFDWEDFGAVNLPGLDLFTLEMALAEDAADLWRRRQDSRAPTRNFVAQACQGMGLPLSDYLQLTGVYALAFRYLKRNYGPEVCERMDRWVLELAAVQTHGLP